MSKEKVIVTVVAVIDAGVIYEMHAYKTFEEASRKFKELVVAEEGRYDYKVSDEDLNDMVDNGTYQSELSGYELALVTSEE